ncbi:DUF421 domain-containing protein [Chitinophaga agrisoli]|uniref:DUF421 domain-containing protein n=1 Tax=Chitinophaga agrisoli TaxID=2607653 RepID=A0A5B2VJL5_9BACT|nr:YetF domain-containing protein [Chitinophaga agrisoli]KAA2238409.1 DUF421 domain-containing protein [Chitinophaga agrisoli]
MVSLLNLLGQGEHLTPLQMSVRAALIFFVALVLIRLGGLRLFGKKTALDSIVVIMLGAILARAVVGASPLLATIAATFVMIVIYRLLAFLCVYSERLEHLLKGRHKVLYKDGEFIWHNMKANSISKADLQESLRLETKQTALQEVKLAYLEVNGRISFLLKSKEVEEGK